MTTNEMITELTQTVSDLKRDVETLKKDKGLLPSSTFRDKKGEKSFFALTT